MFSYVTVHGMAAWQLLHKILTQLRRWDTGALQALDDALHALLEERTREDAAPCPSHQAAPWSQHAGRGR